MELFVFLGSLAATIAVMAIVVHLFETYGHIADTDGKPYDLHTPMVPPTESQEDFDEDTHPALS